MPEWVTGLHAEIKLSYHSGEPRQFGAKCCFLYLDKHLFSEYVKILWNVYFYFVIFNRIHIKLMVILCIFYSEQNINSADSDTIMTMFDFTC